MMDKRGTKWLNSEIEYLKNNYSIQSVEEIANELGRDPSAIRTRAGLMHLKKRKYVKEFKAEIEEMIEAEYTASEIGKKLGFSYHSIYEFCNENGIETISAGETLESQADRNGFGKPIDNFDQEEDVCADWFKYWYQTYRTKSVTRETKAKYKATYANLLNQGLGLIKINEIKREDVQSYANWYGKDHSKITCLNQLQYIRSSFNDAMIDGIVKNNPAANINLVYKEQNMTLIEQKEHREQKKWLEVDEYNKVKYWMLFNLENSYKDSEIKNQIYDTVLFISLKTGARYSEVLGITKSDIDFNGGMIRIDKTWDYKQNENCSFRPTKNTASIRDILVDKETISILEGYIDWLESNELETKEETLFNTGYKSMHNSVINNRLTKVLENLSIQRITVHKLRHTHASLLISKNIPLQVIAKRLGHTDTNMIQRVYGHLLQETEEKGNQMVLNSI